MTKSIPCAKCGQADDLETVDPLGIHLDKLVVWNCRCGNTRAVEISPHLPREFVRKAMTMEERKDRIRQHSSPSP